MISLLIVDDELRTREGLASLINRSGLPLVIAGKASNGTEGLALAKVLHPDIILTDVRMPRMNGITLSTEFRKINPDCQIIFISGYSDTEYLKSAISLKAVSYVEKPVNSSELVNALKAALQRVEENRQSQLLHEQHLNMLSEKIALALLSPNTAGKYLEQLQAIYPDFSSGSCYYVLICQIDGKDTVKSGNSSLFHEQIKNAMQPFGIPFLFAQKETNIFIIHISTPTQDQAIMKQAAATLQAALSDQVKSFLAVGSPVPSPRLCYLSYLNAVICLKKLFFLGYDNICYFTNRDTDMGKSFEPDTGLFHKYHQALRDGDIAQATAITTSLFNSMRKSIYKFETNSIRDVYYRLLINLSSVCRERSLPIVFSHDNSYIWETISQKDTIFALQDYLTQKLALYADGLAAKKGSSQLVHRIYQYIEHHFSDTDLTVNKMADFLHFTPAYLCQIFKAETGNTINSYIHAFRADKAKELLKDKEIKLYEVSLNVGYKNPDYFTIQFKKHAGMTPSEFREKYIL